MHFIPIKLQRQAFHNNASEGKFVLAYGRFINGKMQEKS